MKEIKIFYQNNCKKFLFPENYENLLMIASTSFNLSKDILIFNFIDDEGDKIGISNQFDFDQVLRILNKSQTNTLKLNLDTTNNSNPRLLETSKVESINYSNVLSHSILKSDGKNSFEIDNNIEYIDMENLKNKLRTMVRNEIEESIDQVKIRLINSIENKINNIIPTTKTRNKFKELLSNNPITSFGNKGKIIHHIPDIISPNAALLNKYINTNTTSNIKCKSCGISILEDTNNNINTIYNCFHCDDIYYCPACEEELESLHNHIFLKIKNPDSNHLEALSKLKKHKKIETNKMKYIKNRDKFCLNNIVAFNNLSDKIIIDVDIDINIENSEEFMTFNFNMINMGKDEIKVGSSLECLFDQSDIYGNKIVIAENVKGYEDFDISIMFYSFKSKSQGFYTSKWQICNSNNSMPVYGVINFVFCLRPKMKIKEAQSDIMDYFANNNMGTSSPIKHRREFYSVDEQAPTKTNIKNNNVTTPTNRVLRNNTFSGFSDQYSEIIKKHQNKENK